MEREGGIIVYAVVNGLKKRIKISDDFCRQGMFGSFHFGQRRSECKWSRK